MKIGLLSDTHGHLDPTIFDYFEEVDEIWHAGDIGDLKLMQQLESFRPTKAVFGNIDAPEIRHHYPENLIFNAAGLKVFITHIGGYPGRYNARVRSIIEQEKPGLYICGHSHILKVIPDPRRQLLHINPGACGHHGFHKVRTIVRFTIKEGTLQDLEVIELGLRGRS